MTQKSLKLQMVTTTRDDLVDISHILAYGIDDAFLQDVARPIITSVMGTIASGKKIFADEMRTEILGQPTDCKFHGRMEYDEFWTGERDGKPVEINFINAAWNSEDFSTLALRRVGKSKLLAAFVKARNAGGITFVHNQALTHQNALHIYLEKMGELPVNGFSTKSRYSPLAKAFRQAVDLENTGGIPYWESWTRYLEIKVTDPRLLESPCFAQSVAILTEGAKKVAEALSKNIYTATDLPQRPYLGMQRMSSCK